MLGKILILGDQNKEGMKLKQALKQETNFSATSIPFGEIHSERFKDKEADIFVINPKASYQESITIYYELKKKAELRDIPVLFLIDEGEMRMADLPSGIQEVLYRPLRLPEAIARINLLFKKVHKVDHKNLIQRGPLVIDVEKYEVRIRDEKIDLTYTEFELLRFLCGHPGTVFTREVLLNKVWGYEYYGGMRTVDVHVRRLRSKIEDKGLSFIQTVRNIGYKFVFED